MIDLIRSDYWYTDEYILSKTFSWLTSSSELITRRRHDEKITLSNTIALCVWNLFAKSEERVKLKSYDELVNEVDEKFWIHDEWFINEAYSGSTWFWISK